MRTNRGQTGLLLVALIAFLLVSVGYSQTIPKQIEDFEAPESSGQDQLFRSSVTLVTTDLIVRDDNGQFVPDLNIEELNVYEDGELQDIASLVLVHGGRVFNQLLPPQPSQEGIILPGQSPVDSSSGRVFIIFVDDMHLEERLTPKVRTVFKQVADTLIHEGDTFAVVSSGASAINIDLTKDRSLLYASISKVTGEGFSPRQLIEAMQGGSDGPMEIRWRVHKAFKLARDIVGNLEHLEQRRKSFLYLSSGYDFNPFQMERIKQGMLGQAVANNEYLRPDQDFRLNQLRNMTEPGAGFAETDLSIEVVDLARAANRTNATFYTIDPRGLVSGPSLSYDVPLIEWNRHVQQTQTSMRLLAELTGGFAVVNTNRFDEAFGQIDAETSDYYVVGYYSSNPDQSVRTRELRIEVGRPEVSVRHRTHYSLPSVQAFSENSP